jgi:RsiW-degrading membrane proteinase PrsW (M82 family)
MRGLEAPQFSHDLRTAVTTMEHAAYAACAVAAAALVYRYDLYDREPWYAVLATAAAGALAMRLLGVVEDPAIARLAGGGGSLAAAAFVAASFEEAARLLIVATLALVVPRIFNDPMDGLVYGSIAGIGMAVEESFALLDHQGAGASIAIVDLVRLSGHLVFGGITGFGVGSIRRPGTRAGRWMLPLAACAGIAILLHFLWDVAALARESSGGVSRWPAVAASAVMFAGMVIYAWLATTAAGWSRLAFAPESTRTLWGWPFDWVVKRRRAGGARHGPS